MGKGESEGVMFPYSEFLFPRGQVEVFLALGLDPWREP